MGKLSLKIFEIAKKAYHHVKSKRHGVLETDSNLIIERWNLSMFLVSCISPGMSSSSQNVRV